MVTGKRSVRRLLLPLAAATLVVGCSTSQTADPTPTGGPPPGSTAQPSATPSPGQDASLAAVQACDLLTGQEASQLNAQGSGQRGNTSAAGSTSACTWRARTASDNAVSFGIDVRASQGVEELRPNGGQITDGQVNGRVARQLANGNSCILALKVGQRSRVDVSVVIVGDTNPTQVCQIASQIANIVEPKLPKYEG